MAKVSRELARLARKVQSLPPLVFEPYLRRWHDANRMQTTKRTIGAKALTEKIAVYAIYQPENLSRSTLETCRYLSACGYSTIAVAASGLNINDKTKLLSETWMVIERPNFGYDFGSYREGLQSIWELGVDPECVLILNDSIWFPIYSDTTTISDLEARNSDICGIYQGNHRTGPFLESYLYHVARRVLQDERYQEEWSTIPLSSNRLRTIKLAERGHSQRLMAKGIGMTAIQSNKLFLDKLLSEDDQFLRLTLDHTQYLQPDLEGDRKRVLALASSQGVWRTEAEAHFKKTLARLNFYNSLPFAATKLMGFPLLKKGSDAHSTLWRRQFLRAVEANVLARPKDWIIDEIRHRTPRLEKTRVSNFN